MRHVLALLALPIMAVCSPPEREEPLPDIPDAASDEALSAWTVDVADGTGFQLVVGDGGLTVDATSQGTAWRPIDQVLGGDFEVSAVFEPRDEAGAADDQYGLALGGKNLKDPDAVYTFFLVKPSGEHMIGRHEGASERALVDWKSGPSETSPATPSDEQRLSVQVTGETVQFLLDGTVVATLPREEAQPHGIAGIHVHPNTSVAIRDWKVTGAQVEGEGKRDQPQTQDSTPETRAGRAATP